MGGLIVLEMIALIGAREGGGVGVSAAGGTTEGMETEVAGSPGSGYL